MAGKNIQDKWSEDIARGDSIYESVFAFNMYLPAMWKEVDSLYDNLIAYGEPLAHIYPSFKKFLGFKGRGTPRSLLRSLHKFVIWDAASYPYLVFGAADRRRIVFYAQLQEAVEEVEQELMPTNAFELPEEHDKRRLAIYFLIEWIIQRGNRPFTLDDLLETAEGLRKQVAPLHGQAREVAHSIIDTLLAKEYLEEVPKDPNEVIVGSPDSAHERRYRVPNRRLLELKTSYEEQQEQMAGGDLPPENTGMINQYEVRGVIGSGGAAKVFRVWNGEVKSEFALKLFESRDLYLASKFKDEITILKRLSSPHIISYVDSGYYKDAPYIVTELIDGISLRELIGTSPDLSTVLSIIVPIAQALSYAHKQAIVWRDVKPENILISRAGKVYLGDPGIAKILDSATITSSGLLVGTPYYMSPEQARGGTVDHRSDIYALGVVFYELVTNKVPFTGDPLNVVHSHITEMPVAPRKLNKAVPEAIEAVIMKCLEKDTGKRYQSMDELLADLPAFEPTDLRDQSLSVLINTILSAQDMSSRSEQIATQLVPTSSRRDAQSQAEPFAPPPFSDWNAPDWPAPLQGKSVGFIFFLCGLLTELGPLSKLVPREFSEYSSFVPPPPISAESPMAPPPPPAAAPDLATHFGPLPVGTTTTALGIDKIAGRAVLRLVPQGDDDVATPTTIIYALRPNGITTIGRGAENDIALADNSVSRYHARIEARDGTYMLTDLNTFNGTIVNGDRVTQKVLQPGDRINIGATLWQLAIQNPSEAHPKPPPKVTEKAMEGPKTETLLSRHLD